jgi:hypothetical protein
MTFLALILSIERYGAPGLMVVTIIDVEEFEFG